MSALILLLTIGVLAIATHSPFINCMKKHDEYEKLRKSVMKINIESGGSSERLKNVEQAHLADLDCSSLSLSPTKLQFELLSVQLNELKLVIDQNAYKADQTKLTKFHNKIRNITSSVVPGLEKAYENGKKCCTKGTMLKKLTPSNSRVWKQFAELPSVADRVRGSVEKLSSQIPGVISRINSINKSSDLNEYLQKVEQGYENDIKDINKDIARVQGVGCSK
ncbi:uncharacterized protein LOC116343399 [Contarinia nasturtii]|uniref:uncharacterized protein LOC116343399 n=1 Tax=Contarinia nasturtii TaxID=265458 RepID=UPI0012D4BD1C|nr:uncharacterized protein LOC116343399 [Contarinia nasturtii]